MTKPLLLRALLGEPVERRPIWLMRQAGRYLPEFRALLAEHGFMELCKNPELAARVTLQPIERFGLDGAILFSDILLVLDAMGAGVRFEREGPVIDNPLRSAGDVERYGEVDPERDLSFQAAAVRATVSALPAEVPLLGFAGAPFTLLTYLMVGQGEAALATTRAFLMSAPAEADRLLDRIARNTTALLRAQVEAGARVVQLFDTWAETLPPDLWRRFAAPPCRQVIESLRDLGVPRVYFTRGAAALLPLLQEVGADAYGLDWRIDLERARAILGPQVPLQGNLDPAVLLTNEACLRREVRSVLRAAGDGPHVFNLGHGVLPETPPALVAALVDEVRSCTSSALDRR